jgi:hypothetical protein
MYQNHCPEIIPVNLSQQTNPTPQIAYLKNNKQIPGFIIILEVTF